MSISNALRAFFSAKSRGKSKKNKSNRNSVDDTYASSLQASSLQSSTPRSSCSSGPSTMHLHWLPNVERRGLGDLIQTVNHIALIVSDVGRSTAFYTDIIGAQQIHRPDFDRHGAWLTLGNVELHLIKGIPSVHTGENLIVNHLAIDVSDPAEAFRRLREMEIPFEVNVSVPKGEGKAESEGGSNDNTLSQAFIRDPDGYYIEICNCDVLTDFALGPGDCGSKEIAASGRRISLAYQEGILKTDKAGLSRITKKSFADIVSKTKENVQRMRRESGYITEVQSLPKDEQPKEVDSVILGNFIKRRNVYGDICQSFDEEELKTILLEAGNSAPVAVLLMEKKIVLENHPRLYCPPAYYVDSGCPSKSTTQQQCTHANSFKPEPIVAPKRRVSKLTRTAGVRMFRRSIVKQVTTPAA